MVKRFYRVRVKFCKTAWIMLFLLLGIASISCYDIRVFPLFVFGLAVWLVTIVPAFYLEVVDKN
jgi:hypothetical protein